MMKHFLCKICKSNRWAIRIIDDEWMELTCLNCGETEEVTQSFFQ